VRPHVCIMRCGSITLKRAEGCLPFEATTTEPGDFALRLFYLLSNFSAGQSKTVKFEYGRM